jgi:putative flavoprotein involved in K+ transport
MAHHLDHEVVVVGAGHAGLATSYHLRQRDVDHVVLERDAIGSAWRRQRWDSFTLVTPNWSLDLPGHPYDGADPDGYLPRDAIVGYLERYVQRFDLPVETGVEVRRVAPDGDGFALEANGGVVDGELRAGAVVVAAGFFQRPRLPPLAAELPEDVVQVHASTYRRPDALPEGAVLVVGSGQSGCQIAEELLAAGRRVFLSCGKAGRAPRRYRGRDIVAWMAELGIFDTPVASLPSPAARFAANAHVTGAGGGRTINLHRLAAEGVTLVGRCAGFAAGRMRFADDLGDCLAAADRFAEGLRASIDAHVAERGIDAPPPDPEDDHDGREGFAHAGRTEIDLEAEAVRSVVWANGYGFDYGWIDLPDLLDEFGMPHHDRGVTRHPGLCFVGLHYQTRLASDLFLGVGRDAEGVAEHVARSRASG